MKVLILGSSGLLGYRLFKFLKTKKLIVISNGLVKSKYDLRTRKNIFRLLKKRPDWVINCAAKTDISDCEKNKTEALNINSKILNNLFFLKSKFNFNFKLLQISTDQFYNHQYEYDNKENSKISILNHYTYTKRKAEEICNKNDSIVLRTNFFGKSHNKKDSFSDWVYQKFTSGKKFYLFDDIFFSPLRIIYLCKIIYKIILVGKKYNGTYNLGSRKGFSKKKFAILFAKSLGIYNSNYTTVKSSKIFKIKRPRNMIMNCKKFEKKFKISLPTLKHQILDEIKINYKSK
jgi:dTDP-4-dehydrorhamnose reductase